MLDNGKFVHNEMHKLKSCACAPIDRLFVPGNRNSNSK